MSRFLIPKSLFGLGFIAAGPGGNGSPTAKPVHAWRRWKAMQLAKSLSAKLSQLTHTKLKHYYNGRSYLNDGLFGAALIEFRMAGG